MLQYLGVVQVDINGTLTSARDHFLTNEDCFGDKQKFLFVTKKLKVIHPKKENSILIKDVYRHCVQVKVLPDAGKPR